MNFTALKAAMRTCAGQGRRRLDGARRGLMQAFVLLAGASLVALPTLGHAQAPIGDPNAVVSWGVPMFAANPSAGNRVNNQTLREIAHLSIGGSRVRIKLSNRWNPLPLEVGAAQIALRTTGNGIDPASSRPLAFAGSASVTIPPFAEMVSDWVTLDVPDLGDVAVDLYLPGDTSATGTVLTVRTTAQQTNYVSQTGNFVGSTAFPQASTRTIWNFLAAIDVDAPGRRGAIVAFGDSITEGFGSSANTNSRWPDVLARRLLPTMRLGVADVGIGGNRVAFGGGATNPSALARMDADVIAQTGATHVILLLGINDINGGTSAEDVIASLQQVVARARLQQLKIYVGTITPNGRGSDSVESRRQTVNSWIRTTREHDGFIDFDAVIRDPANPRLMIASLQIGDQLHPNDAGYAVMGNAIPLDLFK
ncbi:GDSL-type esterase/lipase family protein [Piscinibacter koreensis]|uniref:SGNH/GDSL hydrolase family protein n=1 Tax=Piscinibacter koreensis TaxID=2742824 RepID=A0A7Y6TXE8_9BURK|nr:GDSL-type esterase/lipase family protein [Schlegelella koreensis]NUZ07083.1 SGNH/GDSL hydrolase family protein [Schlegelella koreensis]